MFFGLYSISSANNFAKIQHSYDLLKDTLMFMFSILFPIIFGFVIWSVTRNTPELSDDIKKRKPIKIQETQPVKQQPNPDIYIPNLSRIDDLVKQFESLQNGLKLVHYELDKNQTIQFNLLKEQVYNEFNKIDWMKNHNKDVADSYQIIIDDYENAMMTEYERLRKQLNYILKNSIEENSKTISLIKNI